MRSVWEDMKLRLAKTPEFTSLYLEGVTGGDGTCYGVHVVLGRGKYKSKKIEEGPNNLDG